MRRKGPPATVNLCDTMKLSDYFRTRETQLRQQCREWFLVSRHALLGYVRQQVDSATDVELLLEDVARKVTQAVAAGRVPPEDIAPYTFRSLYHKAAELRRQNTHRMETERRYYEEETRHGAEEQQANLCPLEDKHILARKALQSLPQELGAVLTLRLWDELTFPEIAAKLRMSESMVRRRYEKGITMLKERLNQS